MLQQGAILAAEKVIACMDFLAMKIFAKSGQGLLCNIEETGKDQQLICYFVQNILSKNALPLKAHAIGMLWGFQQRSDLSQTQHLSYFQN